MIEIKRIPIVQYYLNEIEKIKKSSPLSVILLVGTLTELINREIANSHSFSYSKLLRKLKKSGKITEEQYLTFDEIREIRNNYAHIDIGKMVDTWDGEFIIENGLILLTNDIVSNSEEPEKEVVRFYSITAELDSERMLDLLTEALKLPKNFLQSNLKSFKV